MIRETLFILALAPMVAVSARAQVSGKSPEAASERDGAPSAAAGPEGVGRQEDLQADELTPSRSGLEARLVELQDPEQGEEDREQEKADREQEQRERGQEVYQDGTQALDEHRWEKAVEKFSEAASLGGPRADGALYWKAYGQNKLGRRADAVSTLSQLEKSFPRSRWLNDAKALGMEVRQASGQKVAPENENDEDLKLIAINGLLNSDPERAIPLLEKFLQGSQPPRLKERALFVLGQSDSPRARQILAQIARGNGNPDLQRKALEYLGMFGGKESQQVLGDIYASSKDTDLKRTILHGLMVGGAREPLLAAAQNEKDPELRADAIRQLGMMAAQAELWQLYEKEPSLKVKEDILQAMFMGGNVEKLMEVARNEKQPELRRAAIRSLGLAGGKQSSDALLSIYASEKDPANRKTVLEALFIQGNARALIDIARKETDPELKKEAVSKLSLMDSKEATDYMLELLNK